MVKIVSLVFLALCVACAPTPRGSSYHNDNQTTVTSSGKSATQSLLDDLVAEQRMIGEQISALSTQLNTASRSQAKKLNGQIGELNDRLAAVERRISTFPASMRNPSSYTSQTPKVDNEFREKLNEDAQKKIASSDPYAGTLSHDKELDRIYRSYVNNPNNPISSSEVVGDKVYRILLITSTKKIDASKFRYMNDVFEQKLPNNKGYAYYQGDYDTEQEAQKACRTVISKGTFRGAIVVAMVGDKRVDLY